MSFRDAGEDSLMSTRNLGVGRLSLPSGLAPSPQTPRFTRGDRETPPSFMRRWQPAKPTALETIVDHVV